MIDVIIHGGNIVERTFLLPPGVPKERAQILRSAFAKTMADPEFLAETQKAKLGVAPIPGEELERRVNGYFKLPEDLKRKIKRVLYD
jgi:tripartite-type tricarboxylate transporter receptor subunit TctC